MFVILKEIHSSSVKLKKVKQASIMPRVTALLFRPLVFKSLKNSLQLEADSLSPDSSSNTNLCSVPVTPMANQYRNLFYGSTYSHIEVNAIQKEIFDRFPG